MVHPVFKLNHQENKLKSVDNSYIKELTELSVNAFAVTLRHTGLLLCQQLAHRF